MAELFDVSVPAISKHLSNIYEEGELQKGNYFQDGNSSKRMEATSNL